MATAPAIFLTEEERAVLLTWIRAGKTEKRMLERARIILMAYDGATNKAISKELRMREATVGKWRNRFAEERLTGLYDVPRSGKPSKYTNNTVKRVLSKIDEPVPEGYGQWNGRFISKALGDVSKDKVWRILRQYDISLQRRKSWCISTDPEFSAKAADIVGLYLDPPDNAIVLCVDEKPSIQALERAQGWLKLPNGKALTGFSHEYKRHGTTTLFAALEVATGLVKIGHYNRKRRVEFLDFMNGLVAAYPDKELHVIVDNFRTHKPNRDMWIRRHKNVHFHYTPTHASWLNQVECWFSVLSRNALKGVSFTSTTQVRHSIDNFERAYNETAAPFQWTKRFVYQKTLKNNYANLCN